jgi:hypothetical protein
MKVYFRPGDDPRNRPGLFEFVCDINGKPFAAMLNKSLLAEFPHPDYGWLWTIQLDCAAGDVEHEMPSEPEIHALNDLSIKMFEQLLASLDILFVGTTLHRNNFEMMFLGRADAVSAIGGAVYELPFQMGQAQERFLHFKSDHDPAWQQLTGIYQIVRQFATPD